MIGLLLESLGSWGWLIAGVLLLLLEIIVSGIFLLWFGLAALCVGVLALVFDFGWQTQWIIFAALSVIVVFCWVRWSRNNASEGKGTDEPLLNRRAERQIGRVFTLEEPLVNGAGRVKIDDTVWRIEGEDMPAGARIRIAGVRGSALLAESL